MGGGADEDDDEEGWDEVVDTVREGEDEEEKDASVQRGMDAEDVAVGGEGLGGGWANEAWLELQFTADW